MQSRGLAQVLAVAVLTTVLAGLGVGSCALAGCWSSNSASHEAGPGSANPSSPALTNPGGTPSTKPKGKKGQPARPGTALPGGGDVSAWMMTRAALSTMLSAPAVRPRLQQMRVYEILQPGQQPLSGDSAAVPVVTFSSVADIRTALADNQIARGTRAILYDCEDWSFTPTAEQQNPVQAATEAASLAHSHGLQLIVAPALDLMKVLAPGTPGQLWQRYVRMGLAGSMARIANVVELQAQSLERDPGTYATFVRQASAQAKAANPNVGMLAGISTNPPGAVATTSQITAAITSSQSAVEGYWLNIPGPGPRCPNCHAPQPTIGATVLADVL